MNPSGGDVTFAPIYTNPYPVSIASVGFHVGDSSKITGF